MNIKQAENILYAASLADDSVIIQGPAGVGKSSIVKQYAKTHNLNCVELFLSMMESGDLLGLPRTSERAGVLTTTWSAPDWIQSIINAAFPANPKVDDLVFRHKEFQSHVMSRIDASIPNTRVPRDTLNSLYADFFDLPNDRLHLIDNQTAVTYKHAKASILFLDELNRAPIDVRQGTMQLILEKELHCHKLPYVNGKQTQIVAAINPADSYQVDELDAALLDRFLYIEVEADAKEWLNYARSKNLNEVTRAYIAEHSKDIYFTPKGQEKIMATPRSWEKLSTFMDHADKIQPETVFDVIKGKIGTALGTKFFQFYNNYSKVVKLADVEKLIAKESKKSSDPQVIAKAIEKLLKNQEAIQKSEMAEEFYNKYVEEKADKALPLLAYLYSLEIELLASFIKAQKAADMPKFIKLAALDEPNGKALFKKITSLAK